MASPATNTSTNAPPGGDLRYVSLDCIVLSTTNPRKQFDGPGFDELVESVRLHGVVQPVLLRPRDLDCMTLEPLPGESRVGDAYELVCGERRFRAAMQCGQSALPAYVRPLTDAEAMELQIVENLQRQDVTAMEEASGFLALLEQMQRDRPETPRPELITEVAAKIGKSGRYVYARLKLNELAPEVKDAISSGRIPVSHGDELVRLPVAEQKAVMDEVISGPGTPPSVREFKKALKKISRPASDYPPADAREQANRECRAIGRLLREDIDLRGEALERMEGIDFDALAPFADEVRIFARGLANDAQTITEFLKAKAADGGKCRVCGCVKEHSCVLGFKGKKAITCTWADESKTLCTNPECLKKAKVKNGSAPKKAAASPAAKPAKKTAAKKGAKKAGRK